MIAPYRAGELDQRITLRRKVESQNAYGTLERTNSDYATVWAHVRPMSGRERDHAQQTEARANYLVVIRNRPDVREEDFVVWNGGEMNVRFVKRRPRALYLELEVEIGAP